MNKSCRCIQIVTPKRYILDGLWFGGEKSKRAIIFLHGLASTAFAHHDFLAPLADKNTAVIFFSNRGHDKVAGIKVIDKKSEKGYKRVAAGEAHEKFTECVDDMRGVLNILFKKKIKEIYLVGHSTGCQKIIYYLSRNNNQRKIAGAVLLCPLSDYAGIKKFTVPAKLKKARDAAGTMVKRGKQNDFLPKNIWPNLLDAQRFLSLYTPDSEEEIFTYAQERRTPSALKKIKMPLFVVLAGNDEYRDRDTEEIAAWFEKNIKSDNGSISIIPKALHGFVGKEGLVANKIKDWIKNNSSF